MGKNKKKSEPTMSKPGVPEVRNRKERPRVKLVIGAKS